MEIRNLGKSGLRVPELCLGAMTFGESQSFMKGVTSPDDEAKKVLERCLEKGINFIDTANVYSEGRSEELLGKWVKDRREQVVIATKCRFPMMMGAGRPDPNTYGLSRKAIIKACEDSLRRLQTDYIDLYQVHMQDRRAPIEETLRALDDLVTSGKVRYVGCSNYTGYRLGEAVVTAREMGVQGYASVQFQWSLVARDAEREVVPGCRHFGLGMLIWSPLSRGFLSGKYRKGMQPPAGSRLGEWRDSWKQIDNERNWQILDAVDAVAKKHNASAASVSLAWLLRQPGLTSVIVGARTVAQLDDNLKALEVKLSDDDVKTLDQASKLDWGYPYSFIGMREPW